MLYFVRSSFKNLVQFSLKALIVFGLVLTLLLISIGYFVNKAEDASLYNDFTVSGEAKRYVTPDTAEVTVGAVVEGTDPSKVQTEATSKINDAVKAIKALGIDEKDIQTNGYSLSPKRDDDNKITGYTIDISVKITIRDVEPKDEIVGRVVTTATDKGLNEVRNLTFSIEDEESILDELKLEAIDNAKERGKELASKSGLKLGKLKNVSDYSYTPYYGYDSASAYMEEAKSIEMEPDVRTLEVQPGQYELSSTVTLTYEIK